MDMNAIGAKVPLGQISLKDTAKMLANKEADPQAGDAVVKSENDDPGLMPKMQAKPAEESDFSVESFAERHKCIVGTTIAGTVVGGIIGGVVSYNSAMGEVRQQPVNTVTRDWDQPVMREKQIGEIPNNYYEPNNVFGFFHNNTFKPVVENAPVVGADGKPRMEHVEKTWTEHGQPIVREEIRNIKDPVLRGYHENRWEDSHDVVVGRDQNGNDIIQREINGWNHNFSPNVEYRTIGTYKVPDVHFETGVNVAGRTVVGILVGMGAGATAAALAGAGIEKVMQKNNQA